MTISDRIVFTIPLVPPSVNHYKRPAKSAGFGGFGKSKRFYLTPEARAFQEAIALIAGRQQVRADEYRVGILVYLGKGQKLDVDNAPKCVLDGMVRAGIIDTDAKVVDLHVRKARDRENPRTVVEVEAL